MRLRLVHQLALLLVTAVLLAVTLLGGVVAWNLREGFSDYLRAQDEAWLERFAVLAGQQVEQHGIGALSGPREVLGPLLQAATPESAGGEPAGAEPNPADPLRMEPRRRMEPGGGAPPVRVPGVAPRPEPPWAPQGQRPPWEPPPQPGARDPHGFGRRLVIVGQDGRFLWGRPPPQAGIPWIERPVMAHGDVAGTLRLYSRPPAAEGVDRAFLLRQYRGIALAGSALVLLALLCAAAVGRSWLRPVVQAQAAARRIAQGAFDVRLARRGPDEVGALIDDINAMAASLQQLEGSRRRWIAELSHELRTPLAVLRAELDGLLDGVRPMNAQALQSLQAEVSRLTRLTEDFHQLALSDLRALPCRFGPVDVAALLREAVDRHAERARAAGLTLSLQELPRLPELQADEQRLQQLLDNLLENSLRYTDPPGIVEVSARREADGLVLAIDDSAPSVPADALDRVFEPLYRVEASRNRRSGGSGLGLAICRAIVHSHGGRIRASVSPRGGLRVECVLPWRPPKEDRAR